MNKAIHYGNKLRNENMDPTKVRMKILDSDGIVRAKEFLNKQRAYLQECNKEFVSFFFLKIFIGKCQGFYGWH